MGLICSDDIFFYVSIMYMLDLWLFGLYLFFFSKFTFILSFECHLQCDSWVLLEKKI